MASLVTAVASFLKDLAQSTPPTHLLMRPFTDTQRHTSANQPGSDADTDTDRTATEDGRSSSSGLGKGNTGSSLCAAFVDCLLAVSSITTPFTLAPPASQPSNSASSTHAAEPRSPPSSAPGTPAAHAQSPVACARGGTLVDESGNPAVMPLALPPGLPAGLQAAVDSALVALLVAAQAMLRKADQQQQYLSTGGAPLSSTTHHISRAMSKRSFDIEASHPAPSKGRLAFRPRVLYHGQRSFDAEASSIASLLSLQPC
eukprot:1155115-Pelagomonas_calceolata.AAC.3